MEIELDIPPEVILNSPLINKGSAFTQKERDELGLNGFLPYTVSTIEQQAQKRYVNFLSQPNQISKFLFLSSLQNRNETLFYRLVTDHISEMLPYIYTPTVGDISLHFSTLYSDHRGVYISYPHKDKIKKIFDSLPNKNIDVIVVTDGERILGLGDVGVGGMTIPIGKLSLYTILGGIDPARTLPIFLDVGTNNEELLNDPKYMGWKHERISGTEYYKFVDSFVNVVKKKFPGVLLQWEDFAKNNAKNLLDIYRDKILSFNDDIQGTAAVVLSAILAASRLCNKNLRDQKIVVLGGGSAGLGICNMILYALLEEGVSEEEALKNFYIVDINGLIQKNHDNLDEQQKKFARSAKELKGWNVSDPSKITLLDVVENIEATVLIGVSTQTGAFTEQIVKTMARKTDRPVILPLSNPTVKSEARPEDIFKWTHARAIVATGSPFAAVEFKGRLYSISQCNNASIFPGLGLGAVCIKAKQITDKMFVRAAKELSAHSPMLKDPSASLFPSFEEIRNLSKDIAFIVAKTAIEDKMAEKMSNEQLKKRIDEYFWNPIYPSYTRKKS